MWFWSTKKKTEKSGETGGGVRRKRKLHPAEVKLLAVEARESGLGSREVAEMVGTPADGAAYRPEVEPEVTEYEYVWNRSGQLAGAAKHVDGLEQLTMSYLYDASGARVVRQKADIGSGVEEIKQDLYVSGGYERRQVRLKRLDTGNPASIWSAAFEGPGAVGGEYEDVEGARLVKYSSGARIQWKRDEGEGFLDLAAEPQIFLSFANALLYGIQPAGWSTAASTERSGVNHLG